MRKGKKISLMNYVWGLHIKSWSKDMFRGREINLLDGLLHQQSFATFSIVGVCE